MASAAAAALCLWQCSFEEAQPLSLAAPEVRFITGDDVITATVGDPVTIETETLSGDRLTKGWYVGDVLVATTDTFTYTFDSPGTYTVKYVVFNGAGSQGKTYTVNVSDVLKMHLSVGDSTEISRKELTTLKLYAIVDRGSDVTYSWSVDGEKKSDKAYFDNFYLPEANVTHKITFEGRNAVGTFTKTFDLDVDEQTLSVDFIDQSKRAFTYTLNLSANILFGGKGAVHKWYVGGELVSEKSELSYKFPELGVYNVDYVCTNEKGEKVEKSWTFDYDEYLADFNYGDFSDIYQIHNAKAAYLKKESLAVVKSPYDGDRHGKVLCWHIDGNKIKTRGGFILRNEYFAENGIDLSQFKGIRFSGRLESTTGKDGRRCPCVAYQTDYSSEYKSVETIRLGVGDGGIDADNIWNYICKSIWVTLKYDVDFSAEGTLKVYPTCWSSNDRTAVVNSYSDYVYIDDIVLY